MGAITIRALRLGDASISFSVHPHADGSVSVQVLETKGDIKISVVFGGAACSSRSSCRAGGHFAQS
jgi:hypothetical protein